MMKTGIELIAEERQRQIKVEGYTLENDETYLTEDLAIVGSLYALPEQYREYPISTDSRVIFKNIAPRLFPWNDKYWKPTPKDRIRELTKAGALIAAEIDRLNRE